MAGHNVSVPESLLMPPRSSNAAVKPAGKRRMLPAQCAAAWLAATQLAGPARAQSFLLLQAPAPSQVTPRDIAPPTPPPRREVLRHTAPEPPATPDNPALAVDVGEARIEGAFPALATQNAAFVAGVAHRHVTLGQLYGAARRLEQAYARAGYILVRVVVPPQRLEPGATVRVVVIDGTIEDVDLTHVAQPIRVAVAARLRGLIGRGQITQPAIERALLLAGDLAGANLRSAIAPGTATGAVRLIVEGGFARVQGQLGISNALPATLGQWQFNGNLAVNGPLGRGDQLYIMAGSQADVGSAGFPKSALAMIGAGYVLPLDTRGTTLTGEFLTSRTQPTPASGAPASVGEYTRALMRLSFVAIRSRRQTLGFTDSLEIVTQSQHLPQFATQASRDHYLAWRLGANWQRNFAGASASLSTTLSQGLAGREGSAALPNSRVGASPAFTNVQGNAELTLPMPSGFALDLVARGTTGFGKPQFLSEQFALDAPNGVSSFASGSFSVDTGATARAELRYPPLAFGHAVVVAPYLFGASGLGWVARPTAVEQGGRGYYRAGSAGLGARVDWATLAFARTAGASLGFEFGHQFSNVVGRRGGDRASLTLGVRF